MTAKEHFPISIMLTVRDMKKSMAFYRDVLGFELEACWPDESRPQWANLLLDQQSVMLGALMTPEEAGQMCGGDENSMKYMETLFQEMKQNQSGVGIVTYIRVNDVDAYHRRLVGKGVKNLSEPRTQFYGIRDFGVQDPDGFRFLFYTAVAMSSCQSCGMPLSGAKPGQMYCQYCTDPKGNLKSYKEVFEGTVAGYFMAMQRMPRAEAEKAARAHLCKMPAWAGRTEAHA